METFTGAALFIAFVFWLAATVERTHRRSRFEEPDRLPFGVDHEGDRDIVRTLQELETVRERDEPTPHTEAGDRPMP
ncbi:hypothetical protein [Lapillicoccus sp.]|uniref:hypothetical protein n=1 Tax=Lapillicoccus sp. TaxID=1909287 RepID=UPI0025D4B41E|nr:hypothetical protein [Lapillicoccus sp.]